MRTARFRSSPRCAPWRARADGADRAGRAQGGRWRLSAVSARSRSSPTLPLADALWRSATAPSAPRSIRRCWRGSTSSPATRITHRQRHDRAARRAQQRAGQARRRHRLRPARDRQRGGAARHRPAAARQPGALALPAAAARTSSDGAAGAVDRGAARSFPMPAGRSARRTNASPELERNVERFTQFLTLVGLTALLVGGVGVANAVQSHLDAQARRRSRTLKALGATGGRVFAIYLRAGAAAGVVRRRRSGSVLGAALPFADRRGVRRASFRCRSRPRCIPATLGAGARSTACSRRSPSRCGRSAAPTTPGVGAVPRCGRAGAALAARALRRSPPRSVVAALGGARGAARLRPRIAAIFVGAAAAVFVALAARRPAGDGASRAGCRARARRRCGLPSPTSTGRAR